MIFAISSATILQISKHNLKRQDKVVSHNTLEKYLLQQNKKRNLRQFECKNAYHNHYLCKLFAFFNKNKIKYSKLKPCFISFEIGKIETKNLTYVEQNNFNFTKHIQSISSKIENKINNCKQKYRSINNECIIETVAISFANATLVEDRFDMFSCFKKLSSVAKVYKKEAEILSFLIIKNLISIYFLLQKEIYSIKRKVLKAKNSTHLSKNSSYAKIYGTYLLNKSASKLLFKSGADIANATNKILDELDQIEHKQKIIFRYIKLLEKTI